MDKKTKAILTICKKDISIINNRLNNIQDTLSDEKIGAFFKDLHTVCNNLYYVSNILKNKGI